MRPAGAGRIAARVEFVESLGADTPIYANVEGTGANGARAADGAAGNSTGAVVSDAVRGSTIAGSEIVAGGVAAARGMAGAHANGGAVRLVARQNERTPLHPGDPIGLDFVPAAFHLFDRQGQRVAATPAERR